MYGKYIDACRDVRSKTDPAYSATTCDINAEMWMDNIKEMLVLMTKAQPSIHSYLNSNYLKDLPVTTLMSSLIACERDMTDKFEKILKSDAEAGKTLMDYTKRRAPLHITQPEIKNGAMRFKDATMKIDYFVQEIALGDFDGDGCEDAVIRIGWKTEGTLGGSNTEVVTRTGSDQKLKWVVMDDDK